MGMSLRGAARWLGLIEDPDDKDDVDAELTQAQDVSRGIGKQVEKTNVHKLEPKRETAVVVTPDPEPNVADGSRIVTVHPRTYNEARVIGEHFRDQIPVIMNLSEMEDADAKRLVDFSAGLTFGLRGTIERITSKVFLLSPQNVTVTAEDKQRIAGGFFNQS